MNLYMFDVDETLEVSGGLVKLSQLVNLRNQGHIIGLCGNWAVVTEYVVNWHLIISLVGPFKMSKYDFLKSVKKHVYVDKYIMVGNKNPFNAPVSDEEETLNASWEFVEEKNFKEGLPK